jgi:hypothetical protein
LPSPGPWWASADAGGVFEVEPRRCALNREVDGCLSWLTEPVELVHLELSDAGLRDLRFLHRLAKSGLPVEPITAARDDDRHADEKRE